MSEQERENVRKEAEDVEVDVEGHNLRKGTDEPDDGSQGLIRESDDPDVEGHNWRK